MLEIALFWLALAVVVGVAANTRGRTGIGWFLLACLISPLIAGLLVLALPRIGQSGGPPPLPRENQKPLGATRTVTKVERLEKPAFAADGVYSGIPYKVLPDGAIDAVLPAGQVRFKSMDHFIAAATGGTAQG